MRRIAYSLAALLFLYAGCGEEETPFHRKARELSRKAEEAFWAGAYDKSKALRSEALALYWQLDDPAGIAEASLALAEVHSRTGQFDSAFVLIDGAREAYNEQGDKEGVRATVRARAALHRSRGEIRKALEVFQQELRVEEAIGEKYGARDLKLNMLPLYRLLGDTGREDRLLKELSEEYAGEGNAVHHLRLLHESGLAAMYRARYEDALERFGQALRLARQAQDSLLVIALHQWRAVAYERLGNVAESFREFTAGLRLTDSTRGAETLREEMLMRVGNIYLRRGQPGEAPRFFTRAMQSAADRGKRLLEGYAMIQMGHAARMRAGRDAMSMFRAATELLDSTGVPWARAYAHLCFGLYALQQHQAGEALSALEKAAEYDRSAQGKRNPFDLFVDCEWTFSEIEQTSPAEAATELLLQLQKTEEGFRVFERRRRFVLMNAYNEMEPRTRSSALNEGLKAFARLRGDYIGTLQRLTDMYTDYGVHEALADKLNRDAMQAQARLEQLGDSLAEAYPRMRALFSSEPVRLDQLKSRLPEGAALVEYIPTRRTLYILVVTRNGVSVMVSSIGKAALKELMHGYRTALSRAAEERGQHANGGERVASLSARLYGLLLRPVERNAARIQRLIVLLPGDLPLIPLHALQSDGARGAFAIQRFAFQYCADPDLLLLERASLRLYPRVVGFGNPGRSSVDVEYEIRDAQAFFREAKLLLGRDGIMPSLLRTEGDFLHAALDVHYRESQPGNSVVSFKDAAGYTGITDVPLGELFSLPSFNTILLSNLNDQGAHAAIVLIFQMNGTAAVVMNGHQPPRKARKGFNEGLYVNLVRGTSVDEAYRNSLLGMMKDPSLRFPWLWGALYLW